MSVPFVTRCEPVSAIAVPVLTRLDPISSTPNLLVMYLVPSTVDEIQVFKELTKPVSLLLFTSSLLDDTDLNLSKSFLTLFESVNELLPPTSTCSERRASSLAGGALSKTSLLIVLLSYIRDYLTNFL
jgi:hypothetical protein